MLDQQDTQKRLFDDWPDRDDGWFETPIGALVKRYESLLLSDLLQPRPGDSILNTGAFLAISRVKP